METSDDYEVAFKKYGKAMKDPLYLTFNLLYHLDIMYNSAVEIQKILSTGFLNKDS